MLLADVIVTHKPGGKRDEIFNRSIESLAVNTEPADYRLTIVVDGLPIDEQTTVWQYGYADHVLISPTNLGLAPSINRALAHVYSLNDYYGHPTHGDPNQVSQYIAYCQDDILYGEDWLRKLIKLREIHKKEKLAFASGIESIEHPPRKSVGGGAILKDWVRMTQLVAPVDFWRSFPPIPRYDPETGRVRAKPNDGVGSSVDWFYMRDREHGLVGRGLTNLVMPGLCQHIGYKDSTWLARELPESEEDKKKAEEVLR
jgi:glycosyltransferase involved in cell wall biosynthesis